MLNYKRNEMDWDLIVHAGFTLMIAAFANGVISLPVDQPQLPVYGVWKPTSHYVIKQTSRGTIAANYGLICSTELRDSDNDGFADTKTIIIAAPRKPFITLVQRVTSEDQKEFKLALETL